MFQEALVRSGYDYKLEYKTATPKQKRSNKRKKDILWFNPPYNLNVMTNVGKEFFKLVDQCFPPGHPLRKIANRQVIKISYSTTPNMNKIIASTNSNILTPEETQSKLCNCLQDSPCPMGGKCLEKNIIYHAKVMEGNGQNCRNYVGNTSTEFKKRLSGHKHTFKNEQANQTVLSNHIHKLESENKQYSVKWNIVGRGKPFSPISNTCSLCTSEKYFILFHPTLSDLNSKREIYSNCRHKQSILLVPKERKSKKRPPG